jgi:flagellar hook-basal body complex protein FliE
MSGISGIEGGMRTQVGAIESGGNRSERLDFRKDQKESGISSPASGELSFGDFMKQLATDANQAQQVADRKAEEIAAGRGKDLHGAMLAFEKADIQFRLLTQVRNKVIDAYREIMRMQV